jgi:DNA excision repair protein ERCC-6
MIVILLIKRLVQCQIVFAFYLELMYLWVLLHVGAGEILGSTSTASNVGVRGLSSSRSARRVQTSAQPEVLIRQLCTYLQQQGGVVASADVVQHFKDRISTQDVALFRQLLKQIATLQKGTGESHWVLKPEYQDKT